MNRLYNIDTLKFVCAVLVVFLHVRTPYQDYILPLTRCAVPCFLIISGYLIFTENKLKLENKLKRSIIKMLHILVWSTLLFAPVKLLRAFIHDDFNFLNFKALVDFVFFNENDSSIVAIRLVLWKIQYYDMAQGVSFYFSA